MSIALILVLAGCAAGPTAPPAPAPAPAAPAPTTAPATAPAPAPVAPPEPAANGELGMVQAGGPDTWYLIPDANPGTRYCLTGALVTDALKADSVRVRFTGDVGTIPPNVRMACTPYTFKTLGPA